VKEVERSGLSENTVNKKQLSRKKL